VFSFLWKCFEIFANIFAFFRFLENFTTFSRKFSRKSDFFVFAKISRYFRENFRENQIFSFFAKIFAKISRYFRENFRENLSFSFSRKFYDIFAKIFAKIGVFHFRENFRENYTRFSRKFSQKRNIFAKRNFVKFRENLPIFAWFSHFRENWKMHFRFNPSWEIFFLNLKRGVHSRRVSRDFRPSEPKLLNQNRSYIVILLRLNHYDAAPSGSAYWVEVGNVFVV
jgi:hypothetical protein